MTPAAATVDIPGRRDGLVAFYLWGLSGLPGFGSYPGPYGSAILRVAVAQTKATGVVSAINFDYRGFDTVGEEFILFVAAAGVAVVLRRLRGEQGADRRSTSRRTGMCRLPAAPCAWWRCCSPGPVVVAAGGWRRTPRPTPPAGSRAG